MAVDDDTADRLRQALTGYPDLREQKMMGALIFMVGGHMCCGVTGDTLMIRLGPDGAKQALRQDHVQPLQIGGGRNPRGFVTVDPQGIEDDTALQGWLDRALAFVATLPPKRPKPRKNG